MNRTDENTISIKNWKLVNFCEFDKYAEESYCAIHGVDKNLNLGDITKVDETKLEPFNMICGGSPCQDFSIAGEQKGSVWSCDECGAEWNPLTIHYSQRHKCPHCGNENINKTRSSLLVEYLRVIRGNKPNFGVYENVKNIVGKKFKDTTFRLFEEELHEYGYNTYWKVLNAKDYGVPQNRERVYLIFIRKELDNGQFKFPEPFDNGIRLKDVLEDDVDEKFYIDNEKVKRFLSTVNVDELMSGINEKQTTRMSDTASCLRSSYYKTGSRNMLENIKNGNGYEGIIESNEVKQVGNISESDNGWKNPQTGRIYSPYGCSPTLNTCGGGQREAKILQKEIGEKDSELRIRKLTPKECFRLMGFDDSAYHAAHNAGISNSQLYKQSGNAIVVDVLYYILVDLYLAMPYLFDDLRLSSFFSGIGSFEVALDRLYEGINNENFKVVE